PCIPAYTRTSNHPRDRRSLRSSRPIVTNSAIESRNPLEASFRLPIVRLDPTGFDLLRGFRDTSFHSRRCIQRQYRRTCRLRCFPSIGLHYQKEQTCLVEERLPCHSPLPTDTSGSRRPRCCSSPSDSRPSFRIQQCCDKRGGT